MLFVEFRFFIFFLIVFAVTWSLRSNETRKRFLTLASFTFYAAWDYRFLALIGFVILVSYICALRVEANAGQKRQQKLWLSFGIGSALSVLALFKYFDFFAVSFADFSKTVGLPVNDVTLNLVLPVGISFYTFQAISYVVDVYRKDTHAEKNIWDVAFYIAFFPQLVAGPIVRAAHFIPQMHATRQWGEVNVRACLILFMVGFIKKAVISDNIAPYVDVIFASPGDYVAAHVVAGVFLYGIQIFCDFSGYSDMAIACAGLLGYKFLANFDAPYLSTSFQDFWRRWHISLSTWLRDYLYIPLGGNRFGEWRRNVNLLTTMVLGGLWHGASFNFIIWGALHGTALALERSLSGLVGSARSATSSFATALVGWFITFYAVNLAWIFFRAPDLATSIDIAHVYLTLQSDGTQTLPIAIWPMLLSLAAIYYLACRWKLQERLQTASKDVFAVGYGAAMALALTMVPLGYRPFIYFQF